MKQIKDKFNKIDPILELSGWMFKNQDNATKIEKIEAVSMKTFFSQSIKNMIKESSFESVRQSEISKLVS